MAKDILLPSSNVMSVYLNTMVITGQYNLNTLNRNIKAGKKKAEKIMYIAKSNHKEKKIRLYREIKALKKIISANNSYLGYLTSNIWFNDVVNDIKANKYSAVARNSLRVKYLLHNIYKKIN
jgi:hypothetical protein